MDGVKQAAAAVAKADFGAGMGVDSGLATYADVARFPAYQERGLGYQDLCGRSRLRARPHF
jgi:hypothetical protein